jgi:hypothetical protein
MRDVHHGYSFGFRVDDVQHAPVTDPKRPLIFEALELLASCWPGIVGERQNFEVDPFEYVSSSASSSFCADGLIARVCLTTWGRWFHALVTVLLVGGALFFPT